MQPYNHHTCNPEVPWNKRLFICPETRRAPAIWKLQLFKDQLELTYQPQLTGGKMYLYALNYNVLRVMSGMAGLAYSN
jgi:hypothetical protein